jgi:hypothetical protein
MPPLVGDHDAAVEVDHGAAVEIDDADGEVAAMPHTPRYEPSWYYEELGMELVSQCLRPRDRNHNLASSKVDWLHRRLLACGHDANGRSHHFMAHSWFEVAYALKEGMPELISSINMRLKLGQCTLAKHLYERVLLMQLTDAQIEVAARKLGEARTAIAERAKSPPRPGEFASMQDEVTQILALPPSEKTVSLPEKAKMLPMMRAEGHRANKGGDFEAAQLWFDCAHSLSQHPSDLLSAANMRLKLVPTSPAAEALYAHALSLQLSERELDVTERKLEQLIEARAEEEERAAAASKSAESMVYGLPSET